MALRQPSTPGLTANNHSGDLGSRRATAPTHSVAVDLPPFDSNEKYENCVAAPKETGPKIGFFFPTTVYW